jgi:hypothetical protein
MAHATALKRHVGRVGLDVLHSQKLLARKGSIAYSFQAFRQMVADAHAAKSSLSHQTYQTDL